MLEIVFHANFSCTSPPHAKPVDALACALHKRMGSFILGRGSALFDKFMCDFTWFSIYFDIQYHVHSIEYLYIDVKRSFGCRKYEKVLLRKSYIGSQISHFENQWFQMIDYSQK